MRFDLIYSEVEYEKEEVAATAANPACIDYEPISQAKEICGYLFRDLTRRRYRCCVYADARSRAILAHGAWQDVCVFGADDCA